MDFTDVDYATLQEIIADKTDFILTLLASCMRKDLDAEEQGIIDEVMPIIDKMQNENIYFSDRLLDLVRRKTGEGLSR